MNIALIAHDAKKELMVQFCIAYCGILSRHNLCATGTTGKMVAEATGLEITRYMSGSQGGDQQISSRISCNEIDLLLFFRADGQAARAQRERHVPSVRYAQHPGRHQYRNRGGAHPRAGARGSRLA